MGMAGRAYVEREHDSAVSLGGWPVLSMTVFRLSF